MRPSLPRLRVALCLCATVCALVTSRLAAQTPPPRQVALAKDYGKLPLSFEANQGQVDPQVRFLSRGNGYSLFLTDRAAVLSLRKPEASSKSRPEPDITRAKPTAPKPPASFKTDVVRMELFGASHDLHVSADSQLPGTANYFIGNDPAKWHSAVPTYARVKYGQVYPGVDLVYYGNQRQLEYDFVVAPHADARPIRLHFAGASKLKLDKNGDLEVIAKNGQIAFHKPVVYQEIAGQRKEVAGSFSLVAKNTVAFALGNYDHGSEVIIDPTLAYSTYLGGSTGSLGFGVAADSSGSVYLTGETADTDFPGTKGFFQATNKEGKGIATVFVTKVNPAGNSLEFSTYLGGSGDGKGDGDVGLAITVDSVGNSYVTGYTYSSDFPLKNPFQESNNGAPNSLSVPFVTKLNPTGTALIYSTYVGGSGYVYSTERGDRGLGIAVNAAGNAYITGSTSSTDFPITAGAYQTALPLLTIPGYLAFPPGVAFVAELNAAGNDLVYSTYLGGSGIIYTLDPPYAHGDGARGIAVDKSGNAYVAGEAASTNFPTTPGVFQPVNNGAANKASNAFLTKLNSTGSSLLYSTYLGGSSTATPDLTCLACDHGDGAGSVTIDSDGNAYIAGGTYSKTDFPTTSGAFQTKNNGVANAFVSKFNAQGTKLSYSTLIGGSGTQGDVAYAMALDPSGDVYLSGFTSSTDFPTTGSAFQTSNHAAAHHSINAFLTEVNPQGTALLYSTYLGGSGYLVPGSSPVAYEGDTSYGIALDCSGSAYLTGQAYSPDFPISASLYQSTTKSPSSAFVSKFSFPAISNCGTSPTPKSTTTTLNSDGNPQRSGTKVTFTAYVQSTSGGTIPTGTVIFAIDGTAGSPVTLDSTGHATYAATSLSAGSHTITATYSGNTAYSASSSEPLTEIIVGPAASITVVSGSSQSTPYGSSFASPLIVVVKDANGNPVSGAAVTFSGSGLSFSSTTATTGSNGEASVAAAAVASGSLTAKASVSGVAGTKTFSLTATKVPLTITANNASVAYNQPIPRFTYTATGFVNGDTNSILTGAPSESTTATKGSAPGPYTITISQGTLAAANYTFPSANFKNGTLTITSLGKVATPTFSVAGGTYTAAQTVTITDSTLGATIYYTTNDTTPTTSSATYTAPIAISKTETLEAIAVATGYTSSAVATATYTIKVTPASISVVSGNGQSGVYGSAYAEPLTVIVKNAQGGAAPGVLTTFTGTGLKFTPSTALTNAAGETSVSVTPTTVSNTLKATATATGVNTPASFTLSAKPAVLTVSANSLSVPYDKPIPQLTYTITGYVNGDTSKAVSGAPTETTTAKQGLPVGAYPITLEVGTLATADYTFRLVNGTLAITSLGTASTPTFSPAGGTYSTAQAVKITDATAGAAIYYTTNGSTPTTASTKYTGPIAVSATETIKAIAVASGYATSSIASATYTIQ